VYIQVGKLCDICNYRKCPVIPRVKYRRDARNNATRAWYHFISRNHGANVVSSAFGADTWIRAWLPICIFDCTTV